MKNMNPKKMKKTMKVSKPKCHYYLPLCKINDCVQLVILAIIHDGKNV